MSYFEDNPVITVGNNYVAQLRGYDPWAKDVMSLIRFKQVRSAFHPQVGKSNYRDKCLTIFY